MDVTQKQNDEMAALMERMVDRLVKGGDSVRSWEVTAKDLLVATLLQDLLRWAADEEKIVYYDELNDNMCIFCDAREYDFRTHERNGMPLPHSEDCLHIRAKEYIKAYSHTVE